MFKIKAIVISSIIAAAVLTGCSIRSERDIGTTNVATTCFEGVKYFVGYNSYVSGAVIDKETMQPQRCN
jgi:hypothetical protein